MASAQAVFFVLAAGGVAMFWRRIGAAPALVLSAFALALACGLGVSAMGKAFSTGFGIGAAEPGLAVVTASVLAAVASSCGVPGILARIVRRGRFGVVAASGAGMLAGVGAAPAAAIALVLPLARWSGGARGAVRLFAAANAAQGLLLPAPPVIAATAILGADWRWVLALGLCLSLVLTGLGGVVAGALPADVGVSKAGAPADTAAEDRVFAPHSVAHASWSPETARPGRAALALAASAWVMLALLAVRSAGDMPSEPFGGGAWRDVVLGVGRPLPVLLAGLAVVLLAGGRQAWRVIGRRGLAEAALARAAPLLLVLACAGGFQAVARETRLAETLADLLAAQSLGLAAPFLMAALFRAVQASPLTAAIATAGILQPQMGVLGLDDAAGRVIAALAVGAGSLSLVTVTDGVFWIVAWGARLGPGRASLWVTGLSVMQGLAGFALLRAGLAVVRLMVPMAW